MELISTEFQVTSPEKRKMCDKNVIQGPSPFTTWTNLMTTNFEEMRKP